MHPDSPVTWDDDSWKPFQTQFQFASGKSVDIEWFDKYLRHPNATEIDLDELVRANQRSVISRRHSLSPPNKIKKAKFRRRLQREQNSSRIRKKSSSSSSSSAEKRPLETQTSVSRTRLLLSSGTRTPPVKVPQTVPSGIASNQQNNEDNSSYYKIKSSLRPVSLRTLGHVTARDEVDNPPWGHPLLTQNQESPVRLNRLNSREKLKNDDWFSSSQRKPADDSDDADDNENVNPSLAVSELVSRFENVRRQGRFSRSRNHRILDATATDPIVRKGPYRHSYHGDTTGDRRNGGLDRNQWDGRPPARDRDDTDHDHLPELTPTSTRNRQPLTRMKSEGSVLLRPNQHHPPPDQYSQLLISEPRRVTKGLSLDSVGLDPYHISRQSPHVSSRDNRGGLGPSSVVYLAAGGSSDVRRDNIPSRNYILSNGATAYVRPEIVVEAPRWESDVEIRKKSNHSFAQSRRPESQPILIGPSVPEWKKQLMQKNREKHGSSDQNVNQFTNRTTLTTINHTDPPWKKELEMFKRRQAAQHSHQLHYQPMEHDWMKESHA